MKNTDIKQILIQHGFKFNKQFGQNFLTEQGILEQIVEKSQISADDIVIEIGAGAGTLTQKLSAVAKTVIAFEIDRNLKPILDITVGNLENVQVIIGDIMKFPMSEIEKLANNQPFKVVANIPYYITTPLIMNFVENSSLVQCMSLTIQKEVAERICAKHDTKDYGALTVAVQAVADTSLVLKLDRELFFPVPNVDSAVININFNRKKFDIADTKIFRKTVKCAFGMRRKTLVNNLSTQFSMTKNHAQTLLALLNLDEKIRGEALSVSDFVHLSNALKKLETDTK